MKNTCKCNHKEGYHIKYYISKKREIIDKQKTFYQTHKIERKKYAEKYKHLNPWIIVYHNAKQRCENQNHNRYQYYGGKGIKFLMTKNEIKQIYLRDQASKMKKPSFDRIDCNDNYIFKNCRFIENKVNQLDGLSKAWEK